MTLEDDGGTAHPAHPTPGPAPSGAPPFVSQDARVPVASLPSTAAIIASVKSPLSPTPSVANSHGAVPATGTCASSAVPLIQGTISTMARHAPCAVPLCHGSNSAEGTCAHRDVSLSCSINSATGVCASSEPPSTMAREPTLHAPLTTATGRSAMKLLVRRVALLNGRVRPFLSLTMCWRSV